MISYVALPSVAAVEEGGGASGDFVSAGGDGCVVLVTSAMM